MKKNVLLMIVTMIGTISFGQNVQNKKLGIGPVFSDCSLGIMGTIDIGENNALQLIACPLMDMKTYIIRVSHNFDLLQSPLIPYAYAMTGVISYPSEKWIRKWFVTNKYEELTTDWSRVKKRETPIVVGIGGGLNCFLQNVNPNLPPISFLFEVDFRFNVIDVYLRTSSIVPRIGAMYRF